MYISSTRAVDQAAERPKSRAAGRVSANVIALGLVSLVTDISSEMITAILPLYLTTVLGLAPLAFGLIDGLYSGLTVVARLAGGLVGDRTQRRKAVAGTGYGLSALSRLGLLAAGPSLGGIGVSISLDRLGKGLRTAPRDALISLSSSPDALGRAFGVHRAMDTVGALTGPLMAFAILSLAPRRFDAVFVASFCIGAAALLILAGFVQDHREPVPARTTSIRAASRGLLASPGFKRICVLASLLSAFSLSDAFVYLLLQRRLELDAALFPLLPLGTAATFLLSSIPLGCLADRIGRWNLFLLGNAALLGVYVLLLTPLDGPAQLLAILLMHGFYYGATDGVLMAAAAPYVPTGLRGSGMALLQSGIAAAAFLSSSCFGALWSVAGVETAVRSFVAGLTIMLLLAIVMRPRDRTLDETPRL